MKTGDAWKGDVPIGYPLLHHPLSDTKLLPDELNFHSPWRSRLQSLPKRLGISFLSRHNPESRYKAPIVCRQSVKIRTADISCCECRNWNGQQSFVSKWGLKELENTRQYDRCTAKTQRNGEGKLIGGCLWTCRLENHWSEREYATEQRMEHSRNRKSSGSSSSSSSSSSRDSKCGESEGVEYQLWKNYKKDWCYVRRVIIIIIIIIIIIVIKNWFLVYNIV
jgi:hypothetical protein